MKNTKLKLQIDKIVHIIFLIIGLICSSTVVFIVAFIFIKGVKPFITDYPGYGKLGLYEFFITTSFTTEHYGILGLVINTIFIVFITGLISLPISVLTALFIVRIAPKKIGFTMQTIIELLASIPSIIYGLFGMGVVNPMIRNVASLLGMQTAGGVSTISVILVLIMMITPTITVLSITSMKAVSESQIQGSIALGATKSQTNFKIVIGGSKSGIFAALILGVGRALGEATAVSMICGGASGIAIGLFKPTSTLTSAMLQGIFESSGIEYDVRFSIAIVLIIIIFVTNIGLNFFKRKLGKYE